MTVAELRQLVVDTAESFLGCKESDGTHRKVIDLYNNHKPLARGYKVKYTDAWCATTVSAVSIKCGLTDIIPTECGCRQMVELFKKLGAWQENDKHTPKPGDVIFYDWQDSGVGDNTGSPDHVGIVADVKNGIIRVVEGNYRNKVDYRFIPVNGKGIRGYGVPQYGKKATTKGDPAPTKKEEKTVTIELNVLEKGDKGAQVKTMQRILMAEGYNMGKYGADGSFGGVTDTALRNYQKAKGLTADGKCGPKTWAKMLKG